MMKKRILIDLSILKHLNCGLGQIALNYGKYYQENITGNEDFELYLLVPKNYLNAFGDKVKYISASVWFIIFPFLLPKFQIWHSIHQLNKFKPFCRSTKLIVTVHDLNFLYKKSKFKTKKYKLKIEKELKKATIITTISEFTQKEIYTKLPSISQEVIIIKNGVENLTTIKREKPKTIIHQNKKFFFSIGVISQKKNFHVLLDLMKLIPDKMLYIAGSNKGKYADFIKKRIINENISNVKLIGTISTKEKAWLYNNCEAFLFPSLLEGFGLPIIEAMEFGKPVFSSKETSLKEIGNDCAFFWTNFEANTMKKCIEENLLLFKKTNYYTKRNIEYSKEFSYKTHMNKYIQLYLKLL